MDMNFLLNSTGIMGGMGALFAIGLAIADKKLHVEEDPRMEPLLEALPGVNCGGCGVPGCGAFADALIQDKLKVTGCPVASPDAVLELAEIMGVEASAGVRNIARIDCHGGEAEVAKRAST